VHDPVTAEPRAPRCPFCGKYEHGNGDSARCVFGEGFLSEGLLESLHRVTAEQPDIFSTPPVDGALPSVRGPVAASVKEGTLRDDGVKEHFAS
jgi:hypothetical protein